MVDWKRHFLYILNIFVVCIVGVVVGEYIGRFFLDFAGTKPFYGGMIGGMFFIWVADGFQEWVEENLLDEYFSEDRDG